MSLRTILIGCTIYCWLIPLFSVAQTPQLLGSEVKIHRGFVMMHREGVQHLVEGPVGIVQLNLFYTPNGEKDWHHYTRFVDVGLSIMQVNTGSNELGTAYGFMPYMRFFPHRGKLVDWTGQFGMGLGYFTKRWSRVEHRKNEMIGSHLNIAVSLQTELQWHITPSLDLTTGLAFTHFSNAGTQKPNLGINVPSASIGIRYALDRGLSPKSIIDTTAISHQREIILLGAGFVNQFDVLMDKQLATTFSVEYGSFSSSRRSRIHGALDIFYNGELGDYYENEGFDYSTIDEFQIGLSGGYSRIVGKMSVYLGMGVYVYAYELPSLRIYNRVGLRYRATERFIVNGTVKTHLFVADYFELGFGYCIWKR
jgi:hypothetical protein